MPFLCIKAVQPCHIQEVISQHLFGISTKFFHYLKAHDLLSDHHLCQVAPKSQSRSHILTLGDQEIINMVILNSKIQEQKQFRTKVSDT